MAWNVCFYIANAYQMCFINIEMTQSYKNVLM